MSGLSEKKIIVMIGAGGVGKTTTAIAVALAAAESGKRVALLSIDPAKRLAAALGMKVGDKLARLSLPIKGKGSVDAAMLDQKAMFDAMVLRHAPSSAVAERIFAHPVYRAASTNLSGPLEYMALAKLKDLAEDPSYDVVVLDTPPDTHALDFLERPNVLAGFMENKVMTWLVKPFLLAGRLGLGRLLNAGEKLMGGIAKVTGVSSLHAFGEFLVLMQEVIQGFHTAGEKILTILRRSDTAFVLVTVPTPAAARSARHLTSELKRLGYACHALVLNRCLPTSVAASLAASPTDPALAALVRRRAGEDQLKSVLTKEAAQVVTVPESDEDLGTIEGLLSLARGWRQNFGE